MKSNKANQADISMMISISSFLKTRPGVLDNKTAIFAAVFLLSCSWVKAETVQGFSRNGINPAIKAKTISTGISNGGRTRFPIYKAGFWIQRLDNPDQIILTPAQINELNKAVLDENDVMADISELEDTVSKEVLLEWLFEDPIPQDRKMYDKKGRIVKEVFYEQLLYNMNIDGAKEANNLIFGVVAKRANIRSFPTDEPALKSPSAKDFDAFQYSAIYPPQSVALLHKSRDGKWGFFQTSFVRGWIKLSDIIFANNRDEISPNTNCLPFTANCTLVVTGSRVRVFKQGGNGQQGAKRIRKTVIETVPMGTAFVLQGKDENHWIVRFPERDEKGLLKWIDAYIDKREDIHIGPLAYTKRNVINQAFKILGEEYGWGGRNGLRDCSGFIKDVFATMDINLPRNSRHQASVGAVLADIEESTTPEDIKKAMNSAVSGITLFGLNGHIMLYLGNINDNYYTLHQLFGYHDKDGFKTVNKAVVTNLELGKGSNMGAIRDRVKSVNIVALDGVN